MKVEQNKKGRVSRILMTEEEYRSHTDSCDGVCSYCGVVTTGGVEPDARGYKCKACGEVGVCGIEELLMEGTLEFTEDEPC